MRRRFSGSYIIFHSISKSVALRLYGNEAVFHFSFSQSNSKSIAFSFYDNEAVNHVSINTRVRATDRPVYGQLTPSFFFVYSQFPPWPKSSLLLFLLVSRRKRLKVSNNDMSKQHSISSNRTDAFMWHCSNDLSTGSKSNRPTRRNARQNSFLWTSNF